MDLMIEGAATNRRKENFRGKALTSYAFGTKELIYRAPGISCFAPIPLEPRPKPPVLPDLTDRSKPYAVCSVSKVTYGVEVEYHGADLAEEHEIDAAGNSYALPDSHCDHGETHHEAAL